MTGRKQLDSAWAITWKADTRKTDEGLEVLLLIQVWCSGQQVSEVFELPVPVLRAYADLREAFQEWHDGNAYEFKAPRSCWSEEELAKEQVMLDEWKKKSKQDKQGASG